MVIREALYEDIKGIIDVNIATWLTAYKGIIKDETLQKRIERREIQIKNDEESYPDKIVNGERAIRLVAVVEEKVIGFISFGKCREESEYDLSKAGEIYAFYVLDEYQGTGVGKKLLNSAFERLKNKYSQILIWCLEDNPTVEYYKYMGGESKLFREICINDQYLDEVGILYKI